MTLGKSLGRLVKAGKLKRNDCVYEPKDLVGAIDAEAIEKTARAFWTKVRSKLKERNPQLVLFEEF